MSHFIKKKLKFTYSLQQSYMTASCYVKAYNEVMFDVSPIPIVLSNNKKILQKAYSVLKIHSGKLPFKNVLLKLYSVLGEVNARYFAAGINAKPVMLTFFEKLIKVWETEF